MNQSFARRHARPAGVRPTLAQVEENYIRKVISETNDLYEAARVLDVNQSTLWRRLHKAPPTKIVPLHPPDPMCGTEAQHWWALRKEQDDRMDGEIAWLKEFAVLLRGTATGSQAA